MTKKTSEEKKEPPPSWLEEESKEGGEDLPLFGTGTVSLQDDNEDEEKAPALSYGSTVNKVVEDDDELVDTKPLKPETKTEIKTEKKKTTKQRRERRPRKHCCLAMFALVEMLAIIACLGLMLTQVLPLLYVPIKDIGILKMALRCYVSLFCVLFLLVEFDAPLVRQSPMLQNFFTRGFLYSFVGLIGMEEAYEVVVSDMERGGQSFQEFHIAWAPLFIKSMSWLMLIVGCIYMAMGMLFLKQLRDGLRRNYKQAVEDYQHQENDDDIV